jgi:hypothetical protein
VKARKEAGDDVEPLESRLERELTIRHEVMVVKDGRESPLAERFAQVARARVRAG